MSLQVPRMKGWNLNISRAEALPVPLSSCSQSCGSKRPAQTPDWGTLIASSQGGAGSSSHCRSPEPAPAISSARRGEDKGRNWTGTIGFCTELHCRFGRQHIFAHASLSTDSSSSRIAQSQGSTCALTLSCKRLSLWDSGNVTFPSARIIYYVQQGQGPCKKDTWSFARSRIFKSRKYRTLKWDIDTGSESPPEAGFPTQLSETGMSSRFHYSGYHFKSKEDKWNDKLKNGKWVKLEELWNQRS